MKEKLEKILDRLYGYLDEYLADPKDVGFKNLSDIIDCICKVKKLIEKEQE